MISIALIIMLSAAIIGALLVFWQDIVKWIKKAANKIKEVLGVAAEGTKTFITKTTDGLKNKSKYYYKNKVTTEWEEVVYTKSVNENDVPADILAKVRNSSVDEEVSTTEELKLAISA